MTTYSPEFKSKVLKQLLPPDSLSIRVLSEKEGVPEATLYTWRHRKISGENDPRNWPVCRGIRNQHITQAF